MVSIEAVRAPRAVERLKDLFEAADYLAALYDSRDIVAAEAPDNLPEIDHEIAEVVQRFPDGLAYLIKDLQAQQEKLKEFKLSALCKQGALLARETKARELALKILKEHKHALIGEVYTISHQKGREHAVIDKFEDLPPEYITVIPEQRLPNTDAILKALQAKKKVPGAHIERYDSFVTIK